MVNKNAIPRIVFAAALLLFSSLSTYSRQPLARQAADDSVGVVVVLEHVQSGKVMTTRTDLKGAFTFSDVEAGQYRLRIGCREAGGGNTNSQAKKFECLAEMRIEISDESRGQVSGTIQKSANN